MSRIILTKDQLQTLASSAEPVDICDPVGKILYSLQPPVFTEEEITNALRAAKSGGP
jgi:hypothetical protein